MNQFQRTLTQIVSQRTLLPICGAAVTSMQIPLEKIPPLNSKLFSNMAIEIAYVEQQILEKRGFPFASSNYFKEHVHALDALYFLEVSFNSVIKNDGQISFRTSSLSLLESYPVERLEHFSSKRFANYLQIDPRPDVDRGVFKSVELRPTDLHTFSLHQMLTSVNSSVIVPCFLLLHFAQWLIYILECNEVVISYRPVVKVAFLTSDNLPERSLFR